VGQSATQHLCKIFLLPHTKTNVVACPIMDIHNFVPSHAPHFQQVTEIQMKIWGEYIEKKINNALH
jgi:hypothetical protein